MKKTLLTLALVGTCAAAFAQGKIHVDNSLSQVTFGTSMLAGDGAFANQVYPNSQLGFTGPLPSGKTLVFGLYGGTTSGSLSLITTLSLNNASATDDGFVVPINISESVVGAGVTGFFQMKVWDSSFANYEAQPANYQSYMGQTAIFQFTPSGSQYYSISTGGGSTLGTAGSALVVNAPAAVPEPGTFALAGLGAAAMLIFRRRK